MVDERLRHHFDRTLWSRLATIMLGIWLLAAPYTFGYESLIHVISSSGIQPKDPQFALVAAKRMTCSDVGTGLVVIVLGLLSLRPRQWPLWLIALAGIWLQFAPLFFWAPNAQMYLNDTLVGALLIVFSILVPQLPYEGWSSDRVVPAGWSYNPSSWWQRYPVIFFGFLGWFLARYLAAYQLGYIDTVWDPFFGDGTKEVITSPLSRSFPISDAGMGAFAYGLEALMGCKGGVGRWRTMPWMVVLFGLLVVPLGFISILLVLCQPIIVGAWCGLCLIMALCMLVMLALSLDEVWAVAQFLRSAKREERPMWSVFFKGGEQAGSTTERVSGRNVWKGLAIHWNIVFAALIGMALLFSPHSLHLTGAAANNNHVVGALVVVCSVVAIAEIARGLRFVTALFGLWLIASPWVVGGFTGLALWSQVVAGMALVLLPWSCGRVRERYGSWKVL